jgi:hypothetical protein
VPRDAFGHVKLDAINPGKWFGDQFAKMIGAEKTLVQKAGYFARAAAANADDLRLIKSCTDLAVECALRNAKAASSARTKIAGGVLRAIEFPRIKGGKPFDLGVGWFTDLVGSDKVAYRPRPRFCLRLKRSYDSPCDQQSGPIFTRQLQRRTGLGRHGAVTWASPRDSQAEVIPLNLESNCPMKNITRLALAATTFAWALLATSPVSAAQYNQRLGNLSTRAQVGTGSNIMITGFVVQDGAPKQVLIRAVGARLAQAPFQPPRSRSPTRKLQLFDSEGVLVLANDNWSGRPMLATMNSVRAFALDQRQPRRRPGGLAVARRLHGPGQRREQRHRRSRSSRSTTSPAPPA